MCQAAHRVLGFKVLLSGFVKIPPVRPQKDEASSVKCSSFKLNCYLSSQPSTSFQTSPISAPAGVDSIPLSLNNRRVLRIRNLRWSKRFTASPSASREKMYTTRRAVQVISTVVMTKSWVSTDELLGTSAAIEEAMTLAREAANAARAAAAYAEARALCEPVEDFPSEQDLLLLERARLTEMARLDVMHKSDLIKPEAENDSLPLVWKEWEGSPREVELNSNLNVIVDRGPEGPPCNEKGSNALGKLNQSETVAVRSSKRKERILKRERVLTKEQVAIVRSGPLAKAKKPQHTYDASDPVRSYMRDIGKSKLLTTAEEIRLAEGIQDLLKMESVKAELMEQMGREPSLSEWAKALGTGHSSLESRIKSGHACRDKMVNSNLRLVVSIAKRYQGRGLALTDLIQEGSMGLINGAEKFDHRRGFKFSTYAHWWIRQSISRAIADQSRTVRLPVHVYEMLSRIKKARNMLTAEHGRVPRDAEVADLVGVNTEKLKLLIKSVKSPKSMEYTIGKNIETTLGELIADNDIESAEDAISKRLLKQDLEAVLNTLSPRERDVLRLRYGLDDGRMRTLEEIGHVFRVTRERIRQIESKAIEKLKQPSRNSPLRDYLDLKP